MIGLGAKTKVTNPSYVKHIHITSRIAKGFLHPFECICRTYDTNSMSNMHTKSLHTFQSSEKDGGDDDSKSRGSTKRSSSSYSTMIDDDTMSFAGSYDYRINQSDVATALGEDRSSLCFPILVYNPKTPITPKNYAELCDNPEHGDFGSEVHTKTIALKEKFAGLELIDYSHKPDADARSPKKGSKGDKKGGKGKGRGKGGKGKGRGKGRPLY